jgi:hypothetical protein
VNSDGGDSSTPSGNTEMVTSGFSSGISQEKYDQLVNLLQQVNLIPSASPTIGSSSNHIHTSPTTDSGLHFHTSSLSSVHSIVSCSIQTDSKFWLIDSGANDHICSSLDWFSSYYKIKPIHVNLPNGNFVVVNYAGNIHFSQDLYITHVLYPLEFRLNLISVSKLCTHLSCFVEFSSHKCVIQDVTSKKTIGLGDQANGLYRLVVNGTHPIFPTLDFQLFNKTVNLTCTSSNVNATSIIPLSALWHFRLGHLSHRRLSHMSQLYPTIVVDNKEACDIYHYAKQKKLSFPVSTSHSSSKYEMLHFDIWGHLSIASVHNHRFFFTIIDDFSRYTWIILLKSKDEISLHIQNFITSIQTQYHVTPKIIRSDNGPEFLLHSFYASHGIIHHKSCVETPQHNGRVARKHQHLLNVGRALLFQSKLPKSFWSYAVLYATFLINKSLLPYLIINHHINCCMIPFPISLFSKCLVHYVMPPF